MAFALFAMQQSANNVAVGQRHICSGTVLWYSNVCMVRAHKRIPESAVVNFL
jgi:hypothetical protein